MHHGVPNLANKHAYVVNFIRQVFYSKNVCRVLENPISFFLVKDPIPLIQY